ncbi:hypothetical protein V498_10546 [Pseudogymnoascus sp. VKM F-4517 (FW-2822)]|nr:hypothetical protein V498_10546 [Pseudogymnoascus sp. VKM F-4517 (FW-2822)]
MGEPYGEEAGVPLNLLLTLPCQSPFAAQGGGGGGRCSESDWRFTSAEMVDLAQPRSPGVPTGVGYVRGARLP